MTGFRDLAHNRDFTVLWMGQTLSALGTRVSGFAFPLVGYALTHSAFWAAAAEAALLVGLVGMLLPGGVLADRRDRRRLMRGAMLLGIASYTSLAVAGILGLLTLPHLLVAAFVSGVSTGLFSPAESSAIRTIVPTEDLPAAYSQMQAREHVASLLGAPLGGALFGITRWLPFLADALSYAVAWAMLLRLRTPLPAMARTGGPTRPAADIREGLAFCWRVPLFRVILFWAPCINLLANALFLLLILRLIAAGVAPLTISLIEVAGGIAGIVGAAIAPWLIERVPTGMLAIAISWLQLPMLIPLAIWNSPWLVAALLAFVLLINPAGNAGAGAYRTAITPPELLGRTQSAMQFVAMATMPVAPLLAGVLLTHLGGRESVLVIGALLIGVALIPTLSASVRSVPRPEVWRAAASVST
ncbi:MAG: MFS transporter [Nocardioides sp.]|uniref:MFS transporter n=1 Tax=Nocardioides sp. TaxID=35761 RepID=UPI0039E57D90